MIRILLFLTLMSLTSVSPQDIALASCCEAKSLIDATEARCTGSMSCSACTNCSRCAHCSAGGSCGVCASYTSPVKPIKPKTVKGKTKSRAKAKTTAKRKRAIADTETVMPKKSTKPYKNHEMLEVIKNCSMRGGEDFTVIEDLKAGAMLTYISTAKDGNWLEVRVNESGNIGFVFKQFVK